MPEQASQPRCCSRANLEIDFRNGGSAEGSLARRGGKPIPIGLGLPTQHSQRPLAAPALSQAILSEVLGRRPGRNGLSAASSAKGQGLRTLAFASSLQTGHFASAIWKFLSGFALSHFEQSQGDTERTRTSERSNCTKLRIPGIGELVAKLNERCRACVQFCPCGPCLGLTPKVYARKAISYRTHPKMTYGEAQRS